MFKRRRTLLMGIVLILVLLLSYVLFFRENRTSVDLPVVSAGIRVQEIRADSIVLTWVVENKSDQTLSFEENCIMQIKLNGQKILYPTEATALAPGEEVYIEVVLADINVDKTNEVKITAISNEGTKVTIRQTMRQRWERQGDG